MFTAPDKSEIDHRTIKLLVGFIALLLASITSLLSKHTITSISASYWEDGWPRNVFVGALCAIAAFLMAYNGFSRREMLLSKFAGLAALGVAFFPCDCGGHQVVPYVHWISAATLFSILAIFCWFFRQRARSSVYPQGHWRSHIYVICGLVIIASMVSLLVAHQVLGEAEADARRLTFYCEEAGLVSFAIAWLTASKVVPGISHPEERLRPFD